MRLHIWYAIARNVIKKNIVRKMKQEDKELLLKDLCSRLLCEVRGRVYAEVSDGKYDISGDMIFYDAPFDVILDGINVSTEEIHVVAIGNEDTVEFIEMQQTDGAPYTIHDFKPYLRPLTSMTNEEREEYRKFSYYGAAGYRDNDFKEMVAVPSYEKIDWLNAHHFDYRGLIERGLAIKVTPDNNPYE